MRNSLVLLNAADNVATALVSVSTGDSLPLPGEDGRSAIVALEDVAFGHKIAVCDIALGTDIVKYGEVIGRASGAISRGDWVHVHNVEALRGRGDLN